jgi:hypothetical protein
MRDEPDGLDRWQKLSPCDEPSRPDMRSYTGSWRRIRPGLIDGLCRPFIGLILMLSGLYAILFWWGYSTMIDPSLPDTEWWAEWKGKAFAGELLIALTLGIGLVCYGCWLLIRGWGASGDP